MFAQALLVSLIPLLPVSAAIDPEDPRAPVQPVEKEAPEPSPGPPQSYPVVDQDRRSALYVNFGFGTPVGMLGVEFVHRLGSVFEVTGGIGIGEGAGSNAPPHAGIGQSLQWAVMPRLRLGDGGSAFTVGAGISGGNYGDPISLSCVTDCGSDPVTHVDSPVSYFLWSNFEIGGEWWWSGGFALRLFGGYAHGWCVSTPCLETGLTAFPYLGVALGYAF